MWLINNDVKLIRKLIDIKKLGLNEKVWNDLLIFLYLYIHIIFFILIFIYNFIYIFNNNSFFHTNY